MLAGSVFLVTTEPVRLGLDLRGGTQIVLETQDTPRVEADAASTDRARQVLERRVNALGVAESSLTRAGERRIIVELPDVQDPARAARPSAGASGPVRGFGVTLTIGVVASMVAAMLVGRALTESVLGRRAVARRPGPTGLGTIGRLRAWLDRRDPDLMRHRRLWLAVSALIVTLAVSGIFVRGLGFGVEFTGGRLMEYSTGRPVGIDDARAAVSSAGFPRAVVQTSGTDDISVRTEALSNAEERRIHSALAGTGGTVTKQRDELIGPTLGDDLRRQALIALAVALAAQPAYLAIRFRWTFGAAAVLAMFHDIAIVAGVFAWLGKPVDGIFLAALLTIIGYSVNDSVVVFDRVRELWRSDPRTPFAKTAGRGALQTIPRAVNTGMGALFILAALALLGGDSLTDFAIALPSGIGVVTYSSVFTATPLAVVFQHRSKTAPATAEIPARRRQPRTR